MLLSEDERRTLENWVGRRSTAQGLSMRAQPWRTETFKVSPDPLLTDKIRDVVGLHLAPPRNAVVFSVDEKPQIQALERTAPVLPMLPRVPERRSFDYVRHGTADLFAQHAATDFRDFLDQIDQAVDPGLEVHVICDNLSTHKAPTVQRWLVVRPAAPARTAAHNQAPGFA